MAGSKGPVLEEVVRAYFAKQGFFAIRSVPLRYEGEEVTDVDIWVYARQSASLRTRAVVDVKNKKSPRALERILWTKGLQALTGADRAFVVTTDGGSHIVRFGHDQKVTLLTKSFLTRLEKTLFSPERISWEELIAQIRNYESHKTDGDWVRRLEDAKSGLVSLPGYPAFNRALSGFSFFAERITIRPQHSIAALRGALLCGAVACIALDTALERVVFEEAATRYKSIATGITYGDSGDSRVQKSVENVLSLIEESMENGRVVSRQAREHINRRFAGVRADLLAEFFSREQNAGQLVSVARELEAVSHQIGSPNTGGLSAEARSVLAVFADFVQIPRKVIISPQTVQLHGHTVSPEPSSENVAVSEKAQNGQTEEASSRKLL